MTVRNTVDFQAVVRQQLENNDDIEGILSVTILADKFFYLLIPSSFNLHAYK